MAGGLAHPRVLAAVAAATLLAGGCGDGSAGDGDGRAPYTVEVVRAEFPRFQRLAEQSAFEIAVRNAGDEPIPNLAVRVHAFGERRADEPGRSLWIVDDPPHNEEGTRIDTWTAGRVEPGATATLRWRVTPIEAGSRTLTYEIAGGLAGDAGAALADGSAARGEIPVQITREPARARVDPRTGEVVREKTRADR